MPPTNTSLLTALTSATLRFMLDMFCASPLAVSRPDGLFGTLCGRVLQGSHVLNFAVFVKKQQKKTSCWVWNYCSSCFYISHTTTSSSRSRSTNTTTSSLLLLIIIIIIAVIIIIIIIIIILLDNLY